MLCTKSEYKLNGYKMRKINALFFIFALFATPAAYAWDASALRDAWDVPDSYDRCAAMSIQMETAVGKHADVCYRGGRDDGSGYCEVGGNRYVRGTMMLVALELNENGAYFCPTVIGSDKKKGWEKARRDWNRPYVTIYRQQSNVQVTKQCFWACKPGYFGDRCSETEVRLCDVNEISSSTYGELLVDGSDFNVEQRIAMFEASTKERCANNVSPSEHDVILGVSRFTNGKHGVFVQPFVASARWYDWNKGPGYINVTPIGLEQLLCMDGYEPNFTNTDCVAVNPDICDVVVAADGGNTCGDKYGEFYDLGDFNAETMELHFFGSEPAYSSSGKHVATVHYNCWGILCTTPGYGFDPNVSRATCVDCGVSDPRNGVNWFGKCVRCDVGEIFDSATGTCLTATALSRDRLYYGPGKDENTAVIEQCWVEPDMYSYSDCVWGNSGSTGKLIRAVGTSIRLLSLPNGGNGGGGGSDGGSGGGSDGGNNDEPWVAGGYHYNGPVGGGSGGGSGINTTETGLDSNLHVY